MWIKIKDTRVNFNNILDYYYSGAIELKIYSHSVDADGRQLDLSFTFDTPVEAKAIVKQLDEALGVKEL